MIVRGLRRTKTLKTGAGPWVIVGLALFIPSIVNEIFDELFIGILQISIYPPSLYEFIDKIYPPIFFIAGLFLIYGLYRQFLVGEKLSQTMFTKNQELTAQKRELSDFAHSLSHDLRSEISVIIGITELMDKEKMYSPTNVNNIRDHVQQISALLNRSIDLADAGLIIDKTDLEQIDLTNLVKEVANVVIPAEINFTCLDKLPIVLGDHQKLYQVFKNLFENAVVHGKPKNIQVGMNISESEIRIHIRNDGEQIPLEIRKLIFQKDFTTKQSGKKGLGLTIIQKIIYAHGWKISLEPDSETTFRITIPININ
jgi:signal transduction histidine kinase